MPISPEYVEVGIDFWNRRGWSRDFHNAFYVSKVPIMRPIDGRFDLEWWERIWPTLREWSATRRGGTRAAMTQRAQQECPALDRLWCSNVSVHLDDDIDAVAWGDVSEFTAHVARIKGVESPVFTSKLCHFLIPQVFPVVDNWAMGNPYATYGEYFQAAQSLWRDTDIVTKNALVSRVSTLIGPAIDPGFPMVCKLIELHLIGKCHRPIALQPDKPDLSRTLG